MAKRTYSTISALDKESRLAKARVQKLQTQLALRYPPRQMSQFQRAGYGSTQRTRGAAVQGEMKYFDCSLTGIPLVAVTGTWVAGTLVDPTTTVNLGSAAVATPLCLFAPTVGSGLNQRIGRSVKMMKVKVSGHITIAAQTGLAAPPASSKIRVVLVMDKQTNAAQMTSAQLFNDSADASSTISSFQNPNNFGRFQVLKEKVINAFNPGVTGVVAGSLVVAPANVFPFKFSYNFNGNTHVNFNATSGGTVADIITNSLHMIAGASNIANVSGITYYSRVSYKE